MPYREHLVVVAGDLGHGNRRSPTHAPATLANLIWSFHLNTSLKSSSPGASANRAEIGTAREGESESNEYGQSLPGTCPDMLYSVLAQISSSPYRSWSVSQGPCGRSYLSRKQTLQAGSRPFGDSRGQRARPGSCRNFSPQSGCGSLRAHRRGSRPRPPVADTPRDSKDCAA